MGVKSEKSCHGDTEVTEKDMENMLFCLIRALRVPWQ